MTTINLLAFHRTQFVPVDRTLEIYFTGCNFACPDCQNFEIQTRTPSNTLFLSPESLIEKLSDYKGVTKQVHILGGEPLLQNHDALISLFQLLKKNKFKNIILFTGFEISETEINKKNPLFKYVDYVKTGLYDKTQLNISKEADAQTGIVLASTNQKIIKVK